MPKVEDFQLHPFGWENDPEEELQALAVLKKGLERTLSQARHLKDSTVKLVVQHLDSAEDKFPSLDELEKEHFLGDKLGDIHLLSNSPMTYGVKPEADPNRSPVVASCKINFIRGGLIFNMHSHHYSNDIMGWSSFTKQLGENCYAVAHKNWMQASAPIPPPRASLHPDHMFSQCVLVHVPKSKVAALKDAAKPDDGTWISAYDAVIAFLWRTLSRIRAPFYQADPAAELVWGEAVNLTKRLTKPQLPARMQGNLFAVVASPTCPSVPPLTVAEFVLEAPLWQLARYIRQMTASLSDETVDDLVRTYAPFRDKQELSVRPDSLPPMTLLLTDWRDADICNWDFGFGRPLAYRHLFDTITRNLVIIYPPRRGPAGEDEGMELQIAIEQELVQHLRDDLEWNKYTEFRGIDVGNPVDN
ncbi:transferase family-domain-containing protein [Apiospora saccharicola]